MWIRAAAFGAAALLLGACGDGPTGSAPEPVPLTRLAPGLQTYLLVSGLKQPETVAITDAAALAQLWARMWSHQQQAPPVPQVDFTKHVVVVAALGTLNTTGTDVMFERAQLLSGGVVVDFIRRLPDHTCRTETAARQPVDVALVERRPGSVTLRPEDRRYSC